MNMIVAPHRFAVVGGGGTVIPPTIASLEAWYDASILTGSDGDPVNTWPDDENAFDATKVVNAPTLQLAEIGGLNTVQFASVNEYYTISSTLLSGATAASFAIVFKQLADPSGDEGAIVDVFGTDAAQNHHPYLDDTFYDGFASTARKTIGNPTPSLASPRILIVRSAASDFTWHFDGTTPAFFSTGTNTVGISGSAKLIGRNAGGSRWRGNIGELCFFSSALTQTEREEMEGYLAHKWGLAANLPGGHPYKATPP